MCISGRRRASYEMMPRIQSQPFPDAMSDDKCQTIDDAIDRMTQLEAGLALPGTRDGVVYFNRLYLEVTKRIKAAVEQDGFFRFPEGARGPHSSSIWDWNLRRGLRRCERSARAEPGQAGTASPLA